MEQNENFDKKYILIRRDTTISYDNRECYIMIFHFLSKKETKGLQSKLQSKKKRSSMICFLRSTIKI